MKIATVICSYEESAHWVSTAVTGFARVSDAVVFCDGGYAMFPGARPCSHPAQTEAAMFAAEASGVEFLAHRPNDVYRENQIQKRNQSLRLAGAILEPDVDWIIIADVDFHVFKCNPAVVRAELENTDALIASYTLLDGIDYLSDADLAERAAKEDLDSEWTCRTENIYRWHPSLLYGPHHGMVSREMDGERKWLRHPSEPAPTWHDLGASLVAYHRRQDRTLLRRKAQEGFVRAREQFDLEPMGDGRVPEAVAV